MITAGKIQESRAKSNPRTMASIVAASRNGLIEEVAELLRHKSWVDHQEAGGKSALLVSAFRGHTTTVQLLLAAGAEVDLADNTQRTALSLASQRGHDDICAILLDAGASVDVADEDGDRPLHAAAEEGHFNVVELLLLANADVNGLDGRGRSALYGACTQTHRVKLAVALIDAKASVNQQDRDGNTALFAASLRRGRVPNTTGSTKLVARLIREGADPFIANHRGRTAYDVALEGGREEVLELLSTPREWSRAAHSRLPPAFRHRVVALVVAHNGGVHDVIESIARQCWAREWGAMLARKE
jgi:uncharacterized protein